MAESGLYIIKSPILKWICERYMYADRDSLNIWVLHGLFLLSLFVIPIGIIHEIHLKENMKKWI